MRDALYKYNLSSLDTLSEEKANGTEADDLHFVSLGKTQYEMVAGIHANLGQSQMPKSKSKIGD